MILSISSLSHFIHGRQIDQLILALPSREYYLKDSSRTDLLAYHNYMTKIATILGADPATVSDDMQEVLDFEIQLANVSLFIFSVQSVEKQTMFIKTKYAIFGS